MTLLERFMQYVSPEPNSGCWLWTGSGDSKGYGQLGVNSRLQLAHRVAYELFKGPIPKSLELDHLCRVTWCVNPAHLEPVTHRENMLRGNSGKYLKLRTHCPAGHEYAGRNLYINPNGSRCCRDCARIKSKRIRDERKQKAQVK